MQEGRVGTIRLVIPWGALAPDEKDAKQVDFSSVDPILLSAAENGVRVVPTIYGTPTWVAEGLDGYDCDPGCGPYAPTSDEALAAWKDFVDQLVERYGPDGDLWTAHPELDRVPVRSWQIWNEQNSPTFYQPEVDPASYERLLDTASEAIKDRDPVAEAPIGVAVGALEERRRDDGVVVHRLADRAQRPRLPAPAICDRRRPRAVRRGRRPPLRRSRGQDRAPGPPAARRDRARRRRCRTLDHRGRRLLGRRPEPARPRARRTGAAAHRRVHLLPQPAPRLEHRGRYVVLVARHERPEPVRLVPRLGPVRGGVAGAEAGLGRVHRLHRRLLKSAAPTSSAAGET